MAKKDFRTAISYRVGFLTSVIAAFWGLLAFRFVSKLVDSGQFSGDSASYFRYTVIGLLFASILEPTAVGTSVSATLLLSATALFRNRQQVHATNRANLIR